MREALEEYGVTGELLVISDGDKAIRYVKALETQTAPCPDLVIIDLNLPKSPGVEVLKSMRESVKCKGITVLILSSSDVWRDRADAMRLGASRYIRKPLRLEEFLKLGAVFRDILQGS